MSKFSHSLEEIALFAVSIFLGVFVAAKIFGYGSLGSISTQVIASVQIFAAMFLCWVAGWKRGSK